MAHNTIAKVFVGPVNLSVKMKWLILLWFFIFVMWSSWALAVATVVPDMLTNSCHTTIYQNCFASIFQTVGPISFSFQLQRLFVRVGFKIVNQCMSSTNCGSWSCFRRWAWHSLVSNQNANLSKRCKENNWIVASDASFLSTFDCGSSREISDLRIRSVLVGGASPRWPENRKTLEQQLE